MIEELFGPVAVADCCSAVDEAIEVANRLSVGLFTKAFTRSQTGVAIRGGHRDWHAFDQ